MERPIPPEILNMARTARRWALNNNNGLSDGMCAESADRLVHAIRQSGGQAKKIYGRFNTVSGEEAHAWVLFQGHILDVTADQFNAFLNEIKMRAIVYGAVNQFRCHQRKARLYLR